MEHFWLGLTTLITPVTLLYLLLGVLIFMIIGLLPGLTGPVGMALLVPITYGLSKDAAFAMLVGGHSAVMFAGSITAIVLGIPGTGLNVATTFDGFALTKQGRAGEAIGAAACASALGGAVGAFVLAGAIPVMRPLVLAFGPPEIFAICLLGVGTVAFVSRTNVLKGVLMGLVGIFLSTIGYNPITGSLRYTFNITVLWDGVELIAVIVGLFAFAEMIEMFVKAHSIAEKELPIIRGILKGVLSVFKNWFLFLRCAIIGTVVGIIPGVGGPSATFVAYAHAVSTSKDPTKFGKGAIEGVIAPESANDAKDGGALIPTLAFGIPGSTTMAILIAALMMHGLDPGPELLLTQQTFLFSLVWLVILGGIVGAIIGMGAAGFLSKITTISYKILVPLIVIVSSLGAIVYRDMFSDLIIALVFGVIGYIMKKLDYPTSTLLIGLVLGNKIEKSLFVSVELYGYSFLGRPITLTILILLAGVLLWPLVGQLRKRWSKNGKR
jgi:putative tricarboxylic transport membrane protein